MARTIPWGTSIGFIAVRDVAEGLKVGTREPAMGLRGIPECEMISGVLSHDVETHRILETRMVALCPTGIRAFILPQSLAICNSGLR